MTKPITLEAYQKAKDDDAKVMLKRSVVFPLRLGQLATSMYMFSVASTLMGNVHNVGALQEVAPVLAATAVLAVAAATANHFFTDKNFENMGASIKEFGHSVSNMASELGVKLGLVKEQANDSNASVMPTALSQQALEKMEKKEGSFWAKTAVDSMRSGMAHIMGVAGVSAFTGLASLPFAANLGTSALAVGAAVTVTAATVAILTKLNETHRDINNRDKADLIEAMTPTTWAKHLTTKRNYHVPEKMSEPSSPSLG